MSRLKRRPTKPCVRQLLKPDRSRNPQSQRRVNSRDPVIGHDSQAAGKRFGLPRGKRFPDIEYSKKYKAQQQIFPVGQDRHAHAERVAARCAVQTPINATPTVSRHWMKIKESKVSAPRETLATPIPPNAHAPRSMNQKGNIAKAIPASEPNVPGALGR